MTKEQQPRSFAVQSNSLEQIERKILPKVDVKALLAEDSARREKLQPSEPLRFAIASAVPASAVPYTLDNSGTAEWSPVAIEHSVTGCKKP